MIKRKKKNKQDNPFYDPALKAGKPFPTISNKKNAKKAIEKTNEVKVNFLNLLALACLFFNDGS